MLIIDVSSYVFFISSLAVSLLKLITSTWFYLFNVNKKIK